ncbi:MarR family winged helix-turn-helix transcriptional regulator [Fodinicola feengrottensis]|uniref:MarR family transcriptional regulator n=1 Tax=Fodinicola feengrottensis TaxID=435914 RepID=A0ABN2GY42_9ACTN|nr:MarR family transcriptional regulator [Fodinicola feengrottensis]
MSTQAAISDRDLIAAWGQVIDGFARTHQLLMAEFTEEFGFPAGWFEVLMRLLGANDERGLPMTRLAREASLTSGGFTKLADRLENAGLLVRRDCPSDRRMTYAQLTPAGRDVAERAQAAHADGLRRYVVEVLGEDDTRKLSLLLSTLGAAHTSC